MQTALHTAQPNRYPAAARHALLRMGPGDESDPEEEGLELPVNPDQGMPLNPEEEGAVTPPA